MNNLNWTIGAVRVFQLVELEAGALIQSIIRGASPANIQKIPWLIPSFADEHGHLKALVQAFLIESEGKFILIDSCNGNDKRRTDVPEWGNLQTKFLQQLRSLGISEHDISVVACTHLHMDHVGWNTRLESGRWVPTFPNASYLFARQEYDYWVGRPEKEIADDKAAFDDSVCPIVAAGLAQLVEVDHQVDSHVRFVPSPGHTPAHVSVSISSSGHRALISGDFLHHPCQIARPAWATDADTLPDEATATRERVLQELTGTSTLLIGTHFANPVAGRVKRNQDGHFLDIGG